MKNHFFLVVMLSVLCSSSIWALKPLKDYVALPDSSIISYQERRVQTQDLFDISLWDCSPVIEDKTKPIIILAGTDYGNMSYHLAHIEMLIKAGYKVVSFDYRGFGKSSSFTIDEKMLYYVEFAEDLKAVIQYVKKSYPNRQLGILGLSMGTVIGTLAVARENVDFFIGEGFIYNPTDVCTRIKGIKDRDLILPETSSTHTLLVSNITCKMLIFVGTEDIVTTLNDSQLIQSSKANRQVVTFEGGHLQGIEVLNNKYITHINNCINK